MSDHFVGSFRQAPPDLGGLRINPSIGQATLDALASRGHKLKDGSHASGGCSHGHRHRSAIGSLPCRRRPTHPSPRRSLLISGSMSDLAILSIWC